MNFLPEDDPRRQLWEQAQSPIEKNLAFALFALLGCKAISGPFDRSRLPQLAELAGDTSACFLFAQHPIGIYRADFLLVLVDPQQRKSRLLVVECDGKNYHTSDEQVARDKKRDAEIKAAGYKIIRVTGSFIHQRMHTIAAGLKSWVMDYNVPGEPPEDLKGYACLLSLLTPDTFNKRETRQAVRAAYWRKEDQDDEEVIFIEDDVRYRWSDTL